MHDRFVCPCVVENPVLVKHVVFVLILVVVHVMVHLLGGVLVELGRGFPSLLELLLEPDLVLLLLQVFQPLI